MSKTMITIFVAVLALAGCGGSADEGAETEETEVAAPVEAEPVETEAPTTEATTTTEAPKPKRTTTTTTTEPLPPPASRKARASLAGTRWYQPGGFSGMGGEHSTFTFNEDGNVSIAFVNCIGGSDCFTWEQNGVEVTIYSHTGSGFVYKGTVGPGHIITGWQNCPSCVSTDPLDNLGKSPQEVVEDKERAIGWAWGAVWCPDNAPFTSDASRRDDCGDGAATELRKHVDLDIDD